MPKPGPRPLPEVRRLTPALSDPCRPPHPTGPLLVPPTMAVPLLPQNLFLPGSSQLTLLTPSSQQGPRASTRALSPMQEVVQVTTRPQQGDRPESSPALLLLPLSRQAPSYCPSLGRRPWLLQSPGLRRLPPAEESCLQDPSSRRGRQGAAWLPSSCPKHLNSPRWDSPCTPEPANSHRRGTRLSQGPAGPWELTRP